MRATYRPAEWQTKQDSQLCAESFAECREDDCPEMFKAVENPQAVAAWMRQHTADTGHTRYWEGHGRPVVVTPPDGSVAARRAAEFDRVRA
ncbi:hypothetical protein [Streptomyces sp. NPDC059003]|uniref:DUF7848 domain-containing protein n=1 Tax=Streptomyces sp. NPDC059003 TaxID=3346691 RepID=UPI00367D99D3